MGGLSVGSDAVVQLTLSFGGGFDSVVDNGDFVSLAVEATFPLRPKSGESTVSGTRVDSLAALNEPVKSIGRVPSAPGSGQAGALDLRVGARRPGAKFARRAEPRSPVPRGG